MIGARWLTTWSPAWVHWYRQMLPAYWIFLFCVLHFPALHIPHRLPSNDQLYHFVAFAILAFLAWRFAETWVRPLPANFAWIALAVLAPYAAIDELLQDPVGRSTELADLLANVTGIVTALSLLEWRRRVAARRARPRFA